MVAIGKQNQEVGEQSNTAALWPRPKQILRCFKDGYPTNPDERIFVG